MIQPIQILIVEDEMIIAANISLQLTEMGYEVSGIIPKGEDALRFIKNNPLDIALIDIQLKGELDGIETAQKMQDLHPNLAIIYLTANADEANFNRAKETHPFAFISKPFKKLDLQRSIELTISQLKCNIVTSPGNKVEDATFILKDCLFVRHQDTMVKVDIKAIKYIVAERNYCRIFSAEKEYLLVTTLKEMDKKLPPKHFLRIHRSYIINLSRIDEIAGTHVVISKKAIPMTKDKRPELLKRLQTI
ncbi:MULTISPECIES: LytR/AlgR family response regulator transcription factor [Salegentibacter]|jgi:DNA-binding LytR/AlgR family response regulator|uniref:Two component transcriptional regulator, LytTR family n=1 Tax=Salegentibacter agarivorans TaxID=345907 RepID=A0A1I2M2U0_9FLAO|nr:MULTISPECIES: response regulator [Salegentibacter]APS38183.1 two-component system response regulator [Salegentibacter sp. T436]SFF85785.1 two component transcriptional regulator, LytTR family [Salegentibacter agarivorans]|tara:strand:- start:1836 stop:2579 length:744 start_codon:yes stop_codon:yes gene_type:complete